MAGCCITYGYMAKRVHSIKHRRACAVGGAWLVPSPVGKDTLHSEWHFCAAYPIMKEQACSLSNDGERPVHGWLVVCPSNSPENVHAGSESKATTAAGCTMDNQLVFDLWSAIITSARVLGVDAAFAAHLEQRIAQLPPMQVGRWGQLQEWMFDWDDPNDVHRTFHTLRLFPSNQFPLPYTGFVDAASTSSSTVAISTGWSMGWKRGLWPVARW